MNLQPTQKHNNGEITISIPNNESPLDFDIDSSCSTPYVSAPSSPGRNDNTNNNGGFFYSAPTSPMHFAISQSFTKITKSTSFEQSISSFEFDSANGSMSSADELFLNGQIRPMRLSMHLQRPQKLSPLMDLEHEEEDDDNEDGNFDRVLVVRGRDLRNRTSSLRRRSRSLSPLRNSPFPWQENNGFDPIFDNIEEEDEQFHTTQIENLGIEETEEKQSEIENRASGSASSSRCSSAGRSSKRWVFLKDFLYRSKSEGTSSSSTVKFWSKSMAFNNSPSKPEKTSKTPNSNSKSKSRSVISNESIKPINGVGKRRGPSPSPHELHYTKNRAQAEEMRKKTFLPYKQGLFGCLGFNSKGYGAMNGLFARSLNPVSSR